MKKTILAACLAVFGATGAFSQTASDTAKVPVRVNVAASVSIQPADGSNGVGAIKNIAANTVDTLVIILKPGSSVRYVLRGRAGAPSVTSSSAGKITLSLPAQSYEKAEISLYTVAGKRVLRGAASASGGALSFSRQNIARGVYLLSVKGAGGGAFTVRHTHSGGRLSISAVFGGDDGASAVNPLRKGADSFAAGDWTVTASASGYTTESNTFAPISGVNPIQNLTLTADAGDGGPGPWEPVFNCPAGISDGGLNLANDNLGLDSNYAVVKFNNGAAPTVTYSDGGTYGNTHTVNGEHVSLKISRYYGNSGYIYNIILTGTAKNGSLRVEDDLLGARKMLYLNGADITNPDGPAINIQSNKRTDVHLVGSCDRRNKLNGKGYDVSAGEPQAKAAFFSEGSLILGGKGSLEVRSTGKHAIVSDGFFEADSANVIIYESPNDGIHANERIDIKGGTLQIKCEGDAIQNERWKSGTSLYPITVSGGTVKIRTTGPKGHGIVSDSNDVVISGETTNIDISLTGNGSKGIRSHGGVKINGGTISLEAYGARESVLEDTSSAAGIKADGDVEITRGVLTIKSLRNNENGKGLNIDGNLTISGGTTKIEADGDGVRVRKSITMSGGTLNTKSTHKSDIDCDGRLNKTGGTLIADNIKQGN